MYVLEFVQFLQILLVCCPFQRAKRVLSVWCIQQRLSFSDQPQEISLDPLLLVANFRGAYTRNIVQRK